MVLWFKFHFSLLVCKKVNDPCILTLYAATLLQLVPEGFFVVDILGFST